jgi:hypothetical protein
LGKDRVFLKKTASFGKKRRLKPLRRLKNRKNAVKIEKKGRKSKRRGEKRIMRPACPPQPDLGA